MKNSIPRDHWLRTRPIAHRGLHSSKSIPENSLAAFELACKNNFPIELDVRASKDGKPVVFHDISLFRMTGMDAKVNAVNSDEIAKLRLQNTKEHIPLLSEVLDLVKGRVPILIEIKNFFVPGKLENEIIKIVNSYKGEIAFVSFNPLVVRYLARFAPSFARGLNTTGTTNILLWSKTFNRFICSFSSLQFIGYSLKRNVSRRGISYYRNLDIPLLAWIALSHDDHVSAKEITDNVFFENYIPE